MPGASPVSDASWPLAVGDVSDEDASLAGVALEGGVVSFATARSGGGGGGVGTGADHGAGEGTGVTPGFRWPIPAPSMMELGTRKIPSSVITVT